MSFTPYSFLAQVVQFPKLEFSSQGSSILFCPFLFSPKITDAGQEMWGEIFVRSFSIPLLRRDTKRAGSISSAYRSW